MEILVFKILICILYKSCLSLLVCFDIILKIWIGNIVSIFISVYDRGPKLQYLPVICCHMETLPDLKIFPGFYVNLCEFFFCFFKNYLWVRQKQAILETLIWFLNQFLRLWTVENRLVLHPLQSPCVWWTDL